MTIPTTASKVTQQGNGVTTVWPYAFEIPGATPTDQSNVTVTLYDTNQSPPLTTELTDNLFSITGVGGNTGGNVTYPLSGTPIAAGVSITIARSAPYVQDTSIPNQSAFYGTVLEAAYDYCTMLIQQLRTLVTYSIQFPLTDTLPPEPLPGADERASTLLGFDADGALALYGLGGGGGGTPGEIEGNYRTVTSSTAMVVTDVVLRCNCATGNQSNTLPAAATMAGRFLFLKKIDSSNNAATFSGDGTIDGNASYTLAQQYNAVTLFCNGVTWDIISQF